MGVGSRNFVYYIPCLQAVQLVEINGDWWK